MKLQAFPLVSEQLPMSTQDPTPEQLRASVTP
jgi:hypothetical protein